MWVNKLLKSPVQLDTNSSGETAETEVTEASESEKQGSNNDVLDDKLDEGESTEPRIGSGWQADVQSEPKVTTPRSKRSQYSPCGSTKRPNRFT